MAIFVDGAVKSFVHVEMSIWILRVALVGRHLSDKLSSGIDSVLNLPWRNGACEAADI